MTLEESSFRDVSGLSGVDLKIENSANMSLSRRKAMLRKVVLDLHSHTKHRRKIKNRDSTDKVVLQEMRMRVYKIMKNLIWEKLENRMCESDTSVKLHRMLDICKDNLKLPINCFDVYTKIYKTPFMEKVLLKCSGIPLLGRVFYTLLVERVYRRYDLLLMMTVTLSELIESKQFLRQEFDNWQVIVRELQTELNNFEMSQTALLQTKPLLVRAVQTKKVSKTILNFGYQSLTKIHNSGEIDDIERNALMKHLTLIESKLRFVERFVSRFAAPKKKRKTRVESAEASLRRKVSLISPLLREFRRADLDQVYQDSLREKKESHEEEIVCSANPEEASFVYFVCSGMFKIRSETDRVVSHLSTNDFFGAAQLIAPDVNVHASAMSSCDFYKLPLDRVEQLMGKYPLFRKAIYSRAAYNYLKCCPYSLAKRKTKYFRRLRRISHFHLKKILDNGTILIFDSERKVLEYVFANSFSALGLLVLKGGLRMHHRNALVQKTRKLFKIEQMSEIKKFLEDQGGSGGGPSQNKSVSGGIDQNLFSVREIPGDKQNRALEGETVEVVAGDAVEIRTEQLDRLELTADATILYLLETKTGAFEDDNRIRSNKKFKVNKINRRKYL